MIPFHPTVEEERLAEDARREKNWKRWGTYLPERQWGTVREDYSADGNAWDYFPFWHAHSRAYRWGEDGLLGWTDRECRLCFAIALWNERDEILKERLFGLANPQGNHGEDVKECYYYLDATPTHSYARALYKYPQAAFPYHELIEANARRGPADREFELEDTGIFAENRYFDITVEYAKGGPDDILIRITAANRGPDKAPLHLLPTLWFRNTWVWQCRHEGCTARPSIDCRSARELDAAHPTLGRFRFAIEHDTEWLFTENETNVERLFGAPNPRPYVKDAFGDYVIHGCKDAVNPDCHGTKAAAHLRYDLKPGEERVVRLRLFADGLEGGFDDFDAVMAARVAEMNDFYRVKVSSDLNPDQRQIVLQAYAGLLWTKQFYHYIVDDWLKGDPGQPPPPPAHSRGRNVDWRDLYSRDILSVPDKWEYPWFAAWDLAFHMIPLARIDPEFAKSQLLLLLREWYMHPNGQIPAYEWNFCDVNPPVYRLLEMSGLFKIMSIFENEDLALTELEVAL